MTIAPREIRAQDISTAWIEALTLVDSLRGRKAFHLPVHIGSPTAERQDIRRLADDLLAALGLPKTSTVRNTIFPAELARRSPEPADLAERYLKLYPRLLRQPSNRGGTYFGRMVALPTPNGAIDQLLDTVTKLRRAANGRRMSSTYEIELERESDLAIYSAAHDSRKMMGFPCLSYCSFHLDIDVVHLAAFYRSHYLIERAYGNYLGLGELLEYVANASGLRVGQLFVLSGFARIEQARVKVRPFLNKARRLVAAH